MLAFRSLLIVLIFSAFNTFAYGQSTSSPRSGGSGQLTNPDISVNVLTLYQNSRRQGASRSESEPGGGFSLQELEMQFLADVDPYLRASVMLSVHPAEAAADAEAKSEPEIAGSAAEDPSPTEKGYAIEPEEVFLETTSLPFVTVKAGRFHAALGRHNASHRHAFPFLDAPLIHQNLLGEDGLTEVGLSASVLIPVPWYMEIVAQGLQGDSPALFASESSSDLAKVYRVRNLFDLTDSATLDFGLSGATGANFYKKQTDVQGTDLTFKWRPTDGGKSRAVVLAAEYLQGDVRGRPEDSKLSGYAAWAQYQFAERWWLQGRNEQMIAKDSQQKQKKNSILLAFFPSEFSGIRLQYDRLNDEKDAFLNTISIQGNYTIGAHPAHSY